MLVYFPPKYVVRLGLKERTRGKQCSVRSSDVGDGNIGGDRHLQFLGGSAAAPDWHFLMVRPYGSCLAVHVIQEGRHLHRQHSQTAFLIISGSASRAVVVEKGIPGSPGCTPSRPLSSSCSSNGRRGTAGDPHGDLWMEEVKLPESRMSRASSVV